MPKCPTCKGTGNVDKGKSLNMWCIDCRGTGEMILKVIKLKEKDKEKEKAKDG